MQVKTMGLSWIVVNDLKEAVKFYTEVVGLKLMEMHEQFGWAELEGHEGGARLGLAQMGPKSEIAAGQNACVTFTVDNIEKAVASVMEQGAKCLGSIQEVPGHVKMQTAADKDGNLFQLVELLRV